MKKLLIQSIILCIIFTLVLPVENMHASGEASPLVFEERYIKSPNLLKAIKQQLNIKGDLTIEDMEKLYILYAHNEDIDDLSGLEFAKNLKELYLDENNIKDLTPLQNLHELTSLYLNRNIVEDVSPLKELINLKKLYIVNNKLRNVNGLENTINLMELFLDGNNINELTPLKNLLALEFLSLNQNSVEDLQPLKELLNLKRLYLEENNINDLDGLENLNNLIQLRLGNNLVDDITPISNLKNLEQLSFWVSNIRDIEPLRNLTNLNNLALGYSFIEDIDPLEDLVKLEDLTLYQNNISNLDALEGLVNLRWLDLHGNKIRSFPSTTLPNLEYLSLSSNQIKNVEFLNSVPNITTLSLFNNNIEDLTPVKYLTSLSYLDVYDNFLNFEAYNIINELIQNGTRVEYDLYPKPVIDDFFENDQKLTGIAGIGLKVFVKDPFDIMAEGIVDSKGKFELIIPKQIAGDSLKVIFKDENSDYYREININVKRGDTQIPIEEDLTPPPAPIVNEVTEKSTSIIGTAEAGSTIIVKADTNVIGSSTTTYDGNFNVIITTQKIGTILTVTARDEANNTSQAVEVTVLSSSKPETPKPETPKQETPKQETPKQETPKQETPKQETPKPETPKPETPKPETPTPSKPVEEENESTKFSDVPKKHPYSEQISFLVNKGIIKGYPDGTFKPALNITRIQAIRIILDEMGIDVENGEYVNPRFSDVNPKSYGYKYIAAAVELGIIKGKPDNTFDSTGHLNRGQMASILVSAYELQGTNNEDFKDVSKKHWAYEAISILAKNDITKGYEDNTFKPNQPISRQHFAVFMYNLLNK